MWDKLCALVEYKRDDSIWLQMAKTIIIVMFILFVCISACVLVLLGVFAVVANKGLFLLGATKGLFLLGIVLWAIGMVFWKGKSK